MISRIILIILLFPFSSGLLGQGFLHTDGKKIVDGNGDDFLIRSIGTGNWMLQEGYMMQTNGIAATQHEFRNKLVQIIGEERTAEFYEKWLDDHFTRTDVDSLAAWGFNALRPALHYKWFTLPIEDEAVPGEQTWLEKGFALTDSLVEWCSENEMYVIFDMHGAPGGQGKNADISDYDPSKPALWESSANKTKLVTLWYKLAERYSTEEWVGGYDLINETNWTFPEGNNSQLRSIYERITDTIRLVDQNHILFIEGNWFANDFSGLTPPWDNNMVYSFHKYWSYNTENSLDWVISLRDQYNVPIWLGESGENSNTWFTNLISLAERKNIGWSWWPVKKVGINNPLRVQMNSGYSNLLSYWRGDVGSPGADAAFQALMQFAENHRIENCIVQRDVIDAMFRQVSSTELKPYKLYSTGDYIYASDFAMGRNGYAYFDKDTANYGLETETYTAWNKGFMLRNDGVDIEVCSDNDNSNGYSVGWIQDGEWMVYTLENATEKLFDGILRTAAEDEAAYVVLEANGKIISDQIYLPRTGSWDNWRSNTFSKVLLPAGSIQLKVRYIKGGANFSYLKFTNPRSAAEAPFLGLLAEISGTGNSICLNLNQPVSSYDMSSLSFTLKVDGQIVDIEDVQISEAEDQIWIEPKEIIAHDAEVLLSYSGSGIKAGNLELEAFQNKIVANSLEAFNAIPGKIEAEDFYYNQGLVLEECLDNGGGFNTAYASPGDYLDYLVYVKQPGLYQVDMRVATEQDNAKIEFLLEQNGSFSSLKTPAILTTGGWQSWTTQSSSLQLPEGKYRLRVRISQGEHNLNWLDFKLLTALPLNKESHSLHIYPNPANEHLFVILPPVLAGIGMVRIFDSLGKIALSESFDGHDLELNISKLDPGFYFMQVEDLIQTMNNKLLIN